MANNISRIPPKLFYGKINQNEESDDNDLDFEGSSSSKYMPSVTESSDTDNTLLEDEPIVDVHIPSNVWTSVTGTTLKTFFFLDHCTPRISEVGPQAKPIDIFNFMVTEEVYELIVLQTNLNAHQFVAKTIITRGSRIKRWSDTNIAEIKKFFGILMYMGLVKYPSISLYWSNNPFYRNNFVPQVMSRNRFQLLLKFIHFADNSEIGSNRLGKVSHLLQILENNYVNARVPGEILAVDHEGIRNKR